MARPSEYDPAIGADICQRISTESLSIRAVCDSDDRFPDANTFYRWMLSNPELRELYAHAKDEQLQILADEITQISDNTEVGEIVTLRGDEREVKMSDMLEHRKLRIDARKWLLAKLAPKKYGDRVTHAGDADNPLTITLADSIAQARKRAGIDE